jgi:hypothetical protein
MLGAKFKHSVKKSEVTCMKAHSVFDRILF